MQSTPPPPAQSDLTRALVEQIVRTGLGISTLLDVLLDELPEEAFPDEVHLELLIEMLTGSIRPAADAAGPAVVTAAIDFMDAAVECTARDMQAAAGAARARGGGS